MRPTDEEIAFAANVRQRDEAIRAECKARGFTGRNGWTSYPAGTQFSVTAPTNEERSRAECIEFRANPPTGSYLAYLTRDDKPGMEPCARFRATTWSGDTLATVTHIASWPNRRGHLTDTRGSFWARGIDGRMYHGRHNGAGIYCRMRPAKHQ